MKNNYIKSERMWNVCLTYVYRMFIVISILFTFGVGQMWAGVSGGYIYFDVSQSGWGSPSSVEYIISHDFYSCWYAMSNISNTKLYYISSGSWGDAKYIAFTKNYGWTNCEGNSYDHRTGYQPSGGLHTAKSTYGVNSGSTYLFYASNSSDGAAITTSSPAGYLSGGYGDLNSTQTINTVVKTGSGSYTAANSKATISITSYAMTGNGAVTKQTTSLGTSVKTQTVSAARTATTTYTVGDVASGYQFDGWYTAATAGTLLSASKTYTYYPTAATTVYARFSEKMSTVTLSASPSGKGSFTIGGAAATSTTAGVTTTRSVTAVPISGYHFVSWAITGGASISSTSTNPTTVTGGGAGTAATLTATFAADDVYTLTVAAGTGISSVSGTTNNIKAGNNIPISATVATGYTWSTWTKTAGSGTLSTFSAGTKNQTVTVGTAGDITLTASATENMSSLSTSCHYDAGNPSYAVPTKTVSSIGISTTANLSATAPSTGYTFVGWTLTHCVRTSGEANSRNITVRSDGSGEAATAVANYEEDLTTTWYIAGDGNGTGTDLTPGSPFSGWGTSGTRMSKKTGYSTVEKYYCSFNVTTLATTNDHFPFKVYNSGNSTYYGNNGYWVTKENNSPALSSTSGNNMKFRPYIAGTYEFEVDNTGANPVLTVHWPVINQLRVSAASPTDATNTNNFDLTDKGSNNWEVKRTLNANTSYTFKMVFDGAWYGDGHEFTRASNSTTDLGDGSDMTLKTDVAGEYTFKFNSSSKNLEITYPTAYTITYGVGDVKGAASVSVLPSFTSGAYVLPETDVEFRKGSTKSGYHWEGWWSNSNRTGTKHHAADEDFTWSATRTGNISVYACYSLITYAVTYHLNGGSGASDRTYNVETSTITLPTAGSMTKTGYTFSGWYDNSSFTGSAVTQIAKGSYGDKEFWAKWTPITYYVSFAKNGGSGDAMSNQSFTYDVAQNLSANTYTRTGYTFDGWATSAGGTVAYTAGQSVSNLSSTANAVVPLFAHWAANNYTVTLDLDEAHKGTIAGKTESQSVTYDAATTTVPLLPTAENGYGLEGYYTDHNGAGTKVIDYDGKWIASVDGYTDADKKWVHDGNVTLYAYYKKAEITSLVLTPSTQAPGESVTATPTIYPTPVGDKMLCWKLLRANGNPMDPQPAEWAPGEGNAVSFDAPATSGSYKVACILRTGSSCDGGTVLDSVVADLVVAGAHTVTIQYQDGSGRTLAASAETIGRPLEWSDEIEPATITGYTFARWDAGDGVYLTDDNGTTTKTTTTTAAIKIKATYDGTLTAVYTKKRMIYFYNTLNWENVYVYFYKNNSYWGAASQGTGANTGWKFDSYPYSEGKHGQMLPMEEGSKIYYFDAEAAGVNASYTNVAFTELEQHGCDYFWNGNKVARRSDYKSGSLPLFVPLADQTGTSMNGGAAMYYNDGYWMNYPDNTGYTLKIYDSQGATTPIRTLRFPFSEDTKMPLKLDVEFNSPGTTFYYTIYREDGDVLSADYGMNQNYHSDVPLTDPSKKIRITTTATGIYTYTLVYKDSPSKNYFISVDYPIGQDDYRVWYSDNATWSQGSAHSGSWHHASDVIRKNTDAEVTKYDTVSFYVSKGNDITVTMKFQYASAIAEGGTITWTDVTSGGIGAADTISNAGVYNFIIKQVGTANPVVEKVEKYSGNYYIRTDNAGSTKWDYYRAADHQLTYSEFSKSRSTNTFGELYTHYYMHWCPRSTNIKFCIANDYSPCISDTLESDLTDWGNLSEGAWLKSDGANPDYKDKYSANIRFMYNESTNKISRAYLSSSTNTDRKFLILRSNTKFWNGDGTDLSGTGETSDDENHVYEAIFQDNEDWIYEREIKLTPSSKFKLYASYAQAIPSENGSQYFRGAYADNNWSNSDNYVLLIGGEGSPCKARIIYDFKTNRLLAAYLPDNSEIEGTLDIDADLMIIREHQEAGQQITFKTNASQLTDVKTVYGVMRFNRWTLNNRANPEDHDKDHSRAATINTYHPLLGLGSQKSMYERALYWISFPFDVNLSDVFGFGTYGVHWIMMDYNGAERARIGYWKDNDEGFWEYIEDRRGVTLKAGKGYVLALELELMQATDTINFWYNQIQQVELFFPSTSSTTGTISQTDVNVTVDSHLCTIDRRTDKTVDDWNNDRRIADSHWNIIGVPSYANYGSTLTDAGGIVNWQTYSKTANLPFLYEWNANDNTYTAQSGSRYNFKAMHAYYVQYAGTLHWTLASATPSSIVARRTYAEEPENVEFRLELQQNDKMIDQTFVKMSNDEEVSANFAFGEDMDKEFNAGKANVYTFIEGYIPTAGNTLPMSDETTIVPVGVKITSTGEYTFAIPEGTEGIGVTLIDNVANTRTNLSALDYTVNLTAGTHDGRFLLEISPIHNAPTDIEAVTGDGLPANGARKVLIDGILYIVKGDKLYDVRGTMIK